MRWQDQGIKPNTVGRPRKWSDDRERKRMWYHRNKQEI